MTRAAIGTRMAGCFSDLNSRAFVRAWIAVEEGAAVERVLLVAALETLDDELLELLEDAARARDVVHGDALAWSAINRKVGQLGVCKIYNLNVNK